MENQMPMSTKQFDVESQEWLDSEYASGQHYRRVISQLDTINNYLGNRYHMTNTIQNIISKSNLEKGSEIRVVDLGCGSGYILKKIARILDKLGFVPVLIGVDSNKEALELASIKLSQYDNELICNLVNENYVIPDTDFLISTHFLYHLSTFQLQRFLHLNRPKVKQGVIFSELYQSSISRLLFLIFSSVLNFEKEVKEDGLKALKRAPNFEQFQNLFSGFTDIQVKKVWFFRTLISGNL